MKTYVLIYQEILSNGSLIHRRETFTGRLSARVNYLLSRLSRHRFHVSLLEEDTAKDARPAMQGLAFVNRNDGGASRKGRSQPRPGSKAESEKFRRQKRLA